MEIVTLEGRTVCMSESDYDELMRQRVPEAINIEVNEIDEWIGKQIQLGTDKDGGVIFRDAETGNHYSVKKIDIEDLPF